MMHRAEQQVVFDPTDGEIVLPQAKVIWAREIPIEYG